MEEVQKNENGTTVPQADGKPKKEDKPKRELTPQQVQQRRKMIVFPLMFLAFAGCMYLIFAPSGKEDVNVESVGGFNADIPLPAEDGIIADKQKAYEPAMLNRKQQDKIQSLQDFGFTGDDETEEPQAEIDLMPEEDAKPQRGGGASSRAAYRDINRQLSTFYETPAVDEEKEDLKRQVAELTDRLQQQNATPTADDQMALLEKSYELAAKYMNGQDGQRGQIAQIPTAGQNGGGIGTPAIPVQAIRETTVSGLQQPMSDADFIRAYSQPRNYGFNTAVGTGYAMGKNTVAACIHQDQTLVDGQAVKLRLLGPRGLENHMQMVRTSLASEFGVYTIVGQTRGAAERRWKALEKEGVTGHVVTHFQDEGWGILFGRFGNEGEAQKTAESLASEHGVKRLSILQFGNRNETLVDLLFRELNEKDIRWLEKEAARHTGTTLRACPRE